MSATEVRVRFGELMRWVVEHQEPVIVESRGKPHVVVLSIAEYEQLRAAQQRQSWQQTLEQVVQVGAKIKARRQGQALTPPEEFIRQTREERDASWTPALVRGDLSTKLG